MKRGRIFRGFTVVELLVVIVIISILFSIVVVSYGSWRHRTADKAVLSDLNQASSSLESYKNFHNDYPPNLAGTGFAASQEVAMTLWTNAPQARTYTDLTPDQNAQLFLNSCNANMPITDGSNTYNTACTFAGQNVHVSGTVASNVVIQGPSFSQDDFTLKCGSACDAARQTILDDFLSQGGTFPISVPKQQVALPDPVLSTYGTATQYCLEAASAMFADIRYHVSRDQHTPQSGPCPSDSSLHYP